MGLLEDVAGFVLMPAGFVSQPDNARQMINPRIVRLAGLAIIDDSSQKNGSPPLLLNNTRERQDASRRSAGNHRRLAPRRSLHATFNRNGGEPKKTPQAESLRRFESWICTEPKSERNSADD